MSVSETLAGWHRVANTPINWAKARVGDKVRFDAFADGWTKWYTVIEHVLNTPASGYLRLDGVGYKHEFYGPDNSITRRDGELWRRGEPRDPRECF